MNKFFLSGNEAIAMAALGEGRHQFRMDQISF